MCNLSRRTSEASQRNTFLSQYWFWAYTSRRMSPLRHRICPEEAKTFRGRSCNWLHVLHPNGLQESRGSSRSLHPSNQRLQVLSQSCSSSVMRSWERPSCLRDRVKSSRCEDVLSHSWRTWEDSRTIDESRQRTYASEEKRTSIYSPEETIWWTSSRMYSKH